MFALVAAFSVLALVQFPLASGSLARATAQPPPDELIQRRTETSKTFDNHDGTYTRVLYSGPVHYRDAHQWRPISSEIVAADESGYAWRNEANSFQTLFKSTMADDFLRFRVGGRAFSFSLENAAQSSVQRRQFGLTYPAVFDGVNLRYDLLSDRVKETLVIQNAQAPLHYRFLLKPPDGMELRAHRLQDDSWGIFRAHRAAPVFVFAPPALSEQGEALPVTDKVSMTVSDNDGQLAIDLSVDGDWLHDPQRTFPIRLDPTITVQPVVQDATVVATAPNSYPTLDDRLGMGVATAPPGTKYRAALQFDLGDIPAGANITDAQLKLYFDGTCVPVLGSQCGNTSHQLDLHRITSSWSPTTTTNGQFQFAATPTTSFTLPNGASNQWMSWSVTSLLQDWITGAQPNYGVLIKRSSEAGGSSGPKAPSSRYAEPSLGPKLEVTYTGDGVDLLPIETAHSNGAELRWTQWAPPSGAQFEKYEIHRSPTARFTPSSSTLLATLTDPAITSYTDTTAAPNRTFSYRLVANSSVSNERRLTLPTDGQGSKIVQSEPGLARSTYIAASYDPCQVTGGENKMYVGPGFVHGQTYRSLLDFDLRTVPANAAISSATLSLWHPDKIATAITVEAHALTADWEEGYVSTAPGCGSGGGASWLETKPGIEWATAGGDFEASSSATITNAVGELASWDNYTLTGLVQRWADIETPNHGVLLKSSNEASGTAFTYYSNDWTVSPTLRPKLTVAYADGTHALAPSVAVVEPVPSAEVHGGAVRITADAGDDRRVDQVEFLVDGQLVGSDTTSPFSLTWDSHTVANGTHSLTARATDDAGNVTTSSAVSVDVKNSNPPTTSILSPSGGANVSGTVSVTATAGDDVGVTKVEFYVDKQLRATDTTAPYNFSWNTLDPDKTAYDGSHFVTSKAYDADDQSTSSQPVYVTAVNTVGTMYQGTIAPFGGAPPDYVVYDPSAQSQLQYGIHLMIHNTSATTWNNVVLRYRWYSPDAPPVVTNSDLIDIGTLAPDGQLERTALIEAPALPDGVNRAQYRLRFDLYDQTGQHWFAGQGNRPYERQLTVTKVLPVGLGLEDYYRYDEESLGAGMRNLINVASGNSILRWTPFSAPGRGLSTTVNLTYNSLESASESPVGNNFSLAISSLTRFGLPLDVHPNDADTLAGRTEKWIGFVDADGTEHRFEGKVAGDGSVYWEEPAGLHLYLREYSATDTERKWAFTTPDRKTYFYDQDGYPTYVEDGNGNEIKFTLEAVSGSPTGITKRIVAVTDASGLDSPAKPNRSFNISYWTEDDARKGPVVGRVKRITDHTGSALDFDYYDDGNLRIITQRGGADPGGVIRLPDRSFVFVYTTTDAQGPAIPGPIPPDPAPDTTQSTRIYGVLDPRGHETHFTYIPPTSVQNKWKVGSRQNRASATTTFEYDNATSETTVSAPLSRVTTYKYDSEGKVTQVTRPDDAHVTMTWTADRMLEKTFEPNGAYTERTYNANGLVTDEWDQLRNHTLYEYEDLPVDASDATGKWRAGRAIPHMSQLSAKTEPKGTATPSDPNDYRTTYDYDGQGNLTSETDALANMTSHTYRPDGALETTTDANNHTTTFADIDANGFATRVIDPLGRVTTSGYDDDGLLVWQQDALHASYSGGSPRKYRTYSDYDAFHRLRRQSSPKSTSTEPGAIIWTSTDYDANDNVVSTSSAFEGSYAGGPRTTTTYDAMDRKLLVTGPDRSVDPAGERTENEYDSAGRVVRVTSPKGMLTASPYDFATFNDYDVMDRVATETRYEVNGTGQITTTLRTYSCYSDTGDLLSVTAPEAAIDPATFDCSTPNLPYTTRYAYDAAHNELSETDPLGGTTSTTYDANGNEESVTNADDKTTTNHYDEADRLTKAEEPFKTVNGQPRDLTTKIEYDAVGNVKREITPRAWDASVDKQTFTDYVKSYQYDDADQLTRVDLPTSSAYAEAQYVHNTYDANGNLTSASLPVTTSDPAAVPEDQRTVLQYFDSGAIRTSKDPDSPRVHFDYTAREQQVARVPENADGDLDQTRKMLWNRDIDGLTTEVRDEGGLASTYRYDADNNLTDSVEARGLGQPGVSALEVQNTFDGFDRLKKVRSRDEGDTNYVATEYQYDKNGNVSSQETDRIETPAGTPVSPGRQQDFVRNQADQVIEQIDHATSDSNDDQRITNEWSPTGQETERVRQIGNAGINQWHTKQVTTWDHYANGELKNLTATNGETGTLEKVYETHEITYEDASGNYVNGNRTSDTFQRPEAPAGDACKLNSCAATYSYDARDRLVGDSDGHGSASAFVLDPVGNVRSETITQNGQPVTRTFGYTGSRLDSITAGSEVEQFFYDGNGNVDCATESAGSQADCSVPQGGPVSTALLEDYSYDYKNRIIASASFNNGTAGSSSQYVYDSMDRPIEERETPTGGSMRIHQVGFVGITNKVAREEERDASGALLATKTYSYDAFGDRTSLTNEPNGQASTTYLYGQDVHGSTSLLLRTDETVTASYGYRVYGSEDPSLTVGDTGAAPLNMYRYGDKRLDPVSNTYDMGARRFAPDTTRFVQQDVLDMASANLSLARRYQTQSRYGLAGGNPISYVETDGHRVINDDGAGGGGGPPNPPPPEPPPAGQPPDEEEGDLGGEQSVEGDWAYQEEATDQGSDSLDTLETSLEPDESLSGAECHGRVRYRVNHNDKRILSVTKWWCIGDGVRWMHAKSCIQRLEIFAGEDVPTGPGTCGRWSKQAWGPLAAASGVNARAVRSCSPGRKLYRTKVKFEVIWAYSDDPPILREASKTGFIGRAWIRC
jgi:RHS repeat-associated protein